MAHLVCECKNLAQTQHEKCRHDKIAQAIHWQQCKARDLEHAGKWYEHRPENVSENEKFGI